MPDFNAKMHQNRFRLGLRPRPRREVYSAPPDPLPGFKGPTSKGRGGEGMEGDGTLDLSASSFWQSWLRAWTHKWQMTQSTLSKTQSRTNCSRPWWSNYEKDRSRSGLFATDVDAVSIDVILSVLILGFFTITYPFYPFYFTNPIAHSWWRTKWRPSVVRLRTGHVSNKYVMDGCK